MATTFVLQPDDYSNITFTCITPMGPESALSNYEVELSSILLNEGDRIAYEYAQYQHREGGEVRDTMYPLVPLEFRGRIVGLGATFALRLQDLLAKTGALMRAINNSSGYLQYKPDGLAGTVMDTYYKYLRAAPPRPLPGGKEFWGAARASVSGVSYLEGIPSRQFDISLMTMPIATSDPTSPIQVLDATTLNNISDGTNDYVTIASATVSGDLPALTRIIAHPLTGGAIGTLWIAKRSSGLGSFVSSYFTATYLSPVSVWSSQPDAARCDGSYYRCAASANNIVYAIRYQIANWSSHEGRAAILLVARNNGDEADSFDVYYRWAIANYPLVGDKKQLSQVGQWEPILLGEIDLPETEMSSQEDLDLYIDICVIRTSGSGTFEIDCIKLLYTDEAAIQVDMPSGYGADTTHDFLLENFKEEISHVIVQATDKLAYICNPYGDFITLETDSDTRLDVAWKRYVAASAIEDDFSGYGSYWKKIADFETDEVWSDGLQTSASWWIYLTEGDQYWRSPAGSGNDATLVLAETLDLSGFSTEDFVRIYTPGALGSPQIRLIEDASNYYYQTFAATGLSEVFSVKIGNMSTVGNPSLANIQSVYIYAGTVGYYLRYDDFRVSAVDPDDSAKFNDTGGAWLFYEGAWGIHELDSITKTLGGTLLDYFGGGDVENLALVDSNLGTDVRFRVKVMRRRASRVGIYLETGIVFRCSDGTAGSEDCYMFLLDDVADEVELISLAAGVRSDVSAAVAFTNTTNTWYYMGIEVIGTSIKCYVSTSLSALWTASSRKFNIVDSTHTSGRCGVCTIGCTGRFDEVKYEGIADLHVPADQIQLSAYALFRTIYPFHEAAS